MSLSDWWTTEEKAMYDRLTDEIEELHARHDALPHWRWIKRIGIEHKIVHKQRLRIVYQREADSSAWHRSFQVKRNKRGES